MQTRYFYILFFFLTSNFGVSQNLNYNIIKKNKTVGSLTLSMITKNNSTIYKIESTTHLPLKTTYKYILVSIFENNELTSSSVISYVNNKGYRSVTTSRDEKGYCIIENGDERYYTDEIIYSESMIYMVEPLKRKVIFSEFLGKNKTIKSLGPNKYQLLNIETGNKSIYQYKNGILENAEIDFGLFTFKLQKI